MLSWKQKALGFASRNVRWELSDKSMSIHDLLYKGQICSLVSITNGHLLICELMI